MPTYLPATRYGGPIYSVHALCKALVAEGHEVHVFTTSVDGGTDSDVPLAEPVVMDGVKVWYFPSRLGRRLYWSPPMLQQLKKYIAEFDVVHLHSVFLWPTWAAARQARKNNIPYVLTPRGMLVKDLIQRKSRLTKSLWIRLIERRTIEAAALVHLTSKIEQAEFTNFAFKARAVCVIPNGVEQPPDCAGQSVSADVLRAVDGSPYILFLGRLNWKKGLDRLIPAMQAITSHRLVIAGNDEEGFVKQIDELIAKYDVADKVTLIPRFVADADREWLYRGASLFVLPSYSENFGNTVPEAMIRGCPVLVTAEVGAATLVTESNCGTVSTGEQLADSLQQLLSDSAELVAMGRKGQIWVEQHLAWQAVAKQLIDEYRQLARSLSGNSSHGESKSD